jgi:flagellin
VETTVSNLSIQDAASSQRSVQALNDAIQQIDSQRSQLGAVQNRFTSTVANLQSISENSTAARSRVQDADFASETAELTKQQTLQQASTAILSQANQLPSSVLKLLQ